MDKVLSKKFSLGYFFSNKKHLILLLMDNFILVSILFVIGVLGFFSIRETPTKVEIE